MKPLGSEDMIVRYLWKWIDTLDDDTNTDTDQE